MADPNLYGRELNKGEFVLREWLVDGGFGDVYRAEQPKLGREVVVKVLRQRLRFDGAVMRRFMREAQLASRLDHPYAAHVYAFSVEADGLLWIAMEMVHGVTLDRWLSEREPLTLDELVPFLERVADVVQTAHDNGIVHRDLKPANIMVIERAGKLLPKLLDFGLAKLLDASLPGDAEIGFDDDDDDDNDDGPRHQIAYADNDEPASAGVGSEHGPLAEDASLRLAATDGQPTRTTSRTGPTARPPYRSGPYRCSGRRVTEVNAASGSPPYMSPEQWTSSTDVGPPTDLYALGVIAYEALTGRRPFGPFTGLSAANDYAEAHRFAPVPPLGDGFTPALDRLFQRALAKRPEERWGTAVEFAAALRTELEARLRTQVRVAARQWQDRERPRGLLWRDDVLADLERFLRQTGAPPLTALETEFVEASRAQALASRRRAVRTRRGLAAVGVAAIIGAVAYPAVLQRRSAEQIVTQAHVEQGRSALLNGNLKEAQIDLAEAYRRDDHSSSTKFMLARALQPRLAEQARFASVKGRMWSTAFSPDGRQIVTTDDCCAQVRDAQTNELLFAISHGDTVYHAVYSADGGRLVTAGGDGTVRISNAANGALVRELTHDGTKLRYAVVRLSPDGRRVAAIDMTGSRVHVWDAITGAPLEELNTHASVFPSLAFSSDGHWLAMSGGGDVQVFDTEGWKLARTLATTGALSLSFDPTGPRLMTGASDGDASIWEIPTGNRIRHLREVGEAVDAVAFSPDGELAVAASRDGAEQVWNAKSGRSQSRFNYHGSKILSVEFDPASKLVLATGANGKVVIADAALGMPVVVLEGPQKVVRVAHFDPSSRHVVGASWDGTARVWDAASPYRRFSSPPISDDCGLITSLEPDRRFIAIGCRDRATRIWDTARDQLLAELPPVTPVDGDFASAYPAVSLAGDRAAIARGNTVEVYELPSRRVLRTITHSAAVNAVAFASTGHDLVSGAIDGSLLVTRDGYDPIALPAAAAGIDAAAILADGRVLAAAGRRLRVHDPSRNAVLADLEVPNRVRTLRVSPDGLRLLTVASYVDSNPPALWDLGRYQLIEQLDGHGGPVYSGRFVADGGILTAGDGAAYMWDGATGRLRQTYRGGARFLADATLTRDGSMVVAGGGDGLLRFWDAASGNPLWTLPAHKSAVIGIHCEGSDIVTRGFAGDLSRWALPKAERVIEACADREACDMVSR